jgi:NADPH:quinone reductase-like Zn-dependent oxidoreductase
MPSIDGIELRRLVCNDEFQPRWESYTLGDLAPEEVRVKSELSAAKHGTEMARILGTAAHVNMRYLADRKHFDRTRESTRDTSKWVSTGNATVGTVMAVGSAVRDLKAGDRVWSGGGFQTVHQGGGFKKLIEGFSAEAACCMDPALFALGPVRDGNVRAGERVLVFGMGAIGLFAVQLARLSGAIEVGAVDPIAARRELAREHGATRVIDPAEVPDFAAASRDWFGDGADVTIEASGKYGALNLAIRATRYGGNVVPLGYYLGEARGLYLGEEFHFNQVNIISARTCSVPQRELSWDDQRYEETLMELFVRGALQPIGLPSPIVGPEELPAAFGKIYHAPDTVIKVAVLYDWEQ